MIISASRRTDIPAFFSEWFFNRLKEKSVYVRNPFNEHQISRISLSPNVVDCIVFWTKNPSLMVSKLDKLKDYDYYFQVTVNGYGKDIEPGIEKETVIDSIRRLSEKIGKKRVVWRYDPILINEKYDKRFHKEAFDEYSDKLKDYVGKAVISFVDIYNSSPKDIQPLSKNDMLDIAQQISSIAKGKDLKVESCAESIDLSEFGIEHGCCIDKKLIEEIICCPLDGKKDKSQRLECGCFESIDIGTYNTCKNGCRYCYAASGKSDGYDPDSPILCSNIGTGDVITERKVFSQKDNQISLF